MEVLSKTEVRSFGSQLLKWRDSGLDDIEAQEIDIDGPCGRRVCARMLKHRHRGGWHFTDFRQGGSANPFQELRDLSSPGANRW
jgi:hypothetical protein